MHNHGNGLQFNTTLPSPHTIFSANIRPKERLLKFLLPHIRTEYGKLFAAVNEASRPGAWHYLPVEQRDRRSQDTEAFPPKQWLELFPEVCMHKIAFECTLAINLAWTREKHIVTLSLQIREIASLKENVLDTSLQERLVSLQFAVGIASEIPPSWCRLFFLVFRTPLMKFCPRNS